ncbi:flagellar basal body rod protein FlgC [Tabrizicola sp.]|jgi:flagellar basal-body rod protein FlgC|uniref:flagellar basal body rod protein FlgC n=1 Tax=Tabrizicola sp. TaxID=2005166 RepID=UPI000BDCF64B|nr:flagellar basal body rod protein FlgC [Tabrizicola sp.]MBY0350746.1 flagellar basal body rod protein FlgC [Tabrizicola sp.]MDK2773861.1 flagellar basal body rod protein FlgC [Tabrizicola sp.]OYX22052.1 MAG: flagellar basal body rod protein FlgC [Rhodobacterales bacterium 32-66-9]
MGNDLISSLAFAASGMETQAMRLRAVSENIANADTPGYRRKVMTFEQAMDTGLVVAGPVKLDQGELTRIYDPGHPLADETGYYDGSNVDLVIEIADAREAQRSYEANLRMFDQTRQMTQSLFDLLRR